MPFFGYAKAWNRRCPPHVCLAWMAQRRTWLLISIRFQHGPQMPGSRTLPVRWHWARVRGDRAVLVASLGALVLLAMVALVVTRLEVVYYVLRDGQARCLTVAATDSA